MSIRITDEDMHSTATRHAARLAEGGWTVTWLPGRMLTRNQAITAMTIAEQTGIHETCVPGPGDRIWPHIKGWGAELGLSGPEAVTRASESPEAAFARAEAEASAKPEAEAGL